MHEKYSKQIFHKNIIGDCLSLLFHWTLLVNWLQISSISFFTFLVYVLDIYYPKSKKFWLYFKILWSEKWILWWLILQILILWILLKFLWYCLRILAVLFTNFCTVLYVYFVIKKKDSTARPKKTAQNYEFW